MDGPHEKWTRYVALWYIGVQLMCFFAQDIFVENRKGCVRLVQIVAAHTIDLFFNGILGNS